MGMAVKSQQPHKPEVFMVSPAVALTTVCVILGALLGAISWAAYTVSH